MMSSDSVNPLAIPPELEAEMTPAVHAFVEALLDQIAQLEKGQKTPQNSSLPPSTQHPHARPQPLKRKSKKKRGGQPGHEKHERPLIPTDQCDDVQPLRPTECRRCSEKLSGSDPKPLRHQVWELPEIKLMAFYRQSKRRTADFLGTLLGQPCCPALTVKIQNQVTAALRPSYEALAAELPTQEQLNIDETATKEENGKAWLWTFVAQMFTVFAVRATREATALGVFLGERFRGIVTCDRAKMYWQVGRLPWCRAHLKRDFQAIIDGGDGRAKHLGQRLRRATCELFEHWADYRAGRISRAALLRRMGPVRRKVERLLLRGTQSGSRNVRGTCRELYEHRQWLWTFLRHEGVEPTNNAGERSLRHAVIWRKLSFGTQSASGSRFVETMLTVIETCRQQRRNVFSFLTAAVEAHLTHQSAPSLLPRV